MKAPDFQRLEASVSKLDGVARGGTAPGVELRRGDTVALEPVHWLWRGYIPAAMLTIIGGSPGCGKTTIALACAAITTRASRWPTGEQCDEPGDVLIWSGEDAPAVLAARLVAAGADMSRVHFIEGMQGGVAFDPGRDMPALEESAAALPAPRLLILDPIVSAVAGDSHKGAEVRRSLQPVVALAQRLGCAVLGVTHFSKGTSGRDPVERVTGSIAFAALARVVLVAAKVKCDDGESEEPRRVLLRAKSNIGPDDGGFAYALERVEVAPEVEGQRVNWLEALNGTARELLAEAESDPQSDQATEASAVTEFLLDLLAGGQVEAKAVKAEATGAGYTWHACDRAARALGIERKKVGMNGGWVWRMPEGCAKKAKATAQTEMNSLQPSQPSAPFSTDAGDAEVFL
ncbi:MAG: AAA family ATPase [Burkholderiales bacterium]